MSERYISDVEVIVMNEINYEDIPGLCFPHELDYIVIHREESFDLTLKVGNFMFRQLRLTTDENGVVGVGGLGPLLADLAVDGPQACQLVCGTDAPKAFTLLPCRRDVGMKAVEFCPGHFLTMLRGTKRTHEQAAEYVSFYKTESGVVSLKAVLLFAKFDTDELKKQEVIFSRTDAMTNDSGLYTVDVSPRLWTGITPEGFRLVMYEIRAGLRSMHYAVEPTADAAPHTLCFRNNFGCADTFHFFGNLDTQLKPERSAATIDGVLRNYRVNATAETTGFTGPMRQGTFPLFADLCATKEVHERNISGRELCITGQECKMSNDRYAPQSGSLTWRDAGSATPFAPMRRVRVFDPSFDLSFE